MPTKDSNLQIEEENGITKVEFLDRNILEEANIQQIGEEIRHLIEGAGNPKLLISFEHVEHLSSAALGMLISIDNQLRQKGGQLRLSNINPQIYEVFSITNLDKRFQIHETREQAKRSFH